MSCGLMNALDEALGLALAATERGAAAAAAAWSVPTRFLLYGLPGCGKRHTVAALARRHRMRLHVLRPADLAAAQGGFGDAERAVARAFDEWLAPGNAGDLGAVLLLEDVDRLCPRRDSSASADARVVATLLTRIDGFARTTGSAARAVPRFLVGCTSRREAVDEAMRRAGRLDREIEVLPPSAAHRLALLAELLAGAPLASDVSLESIASGTPGYSCADLVALASAALQRAGSREDAWLDGRAPCVTRADVDAALSLCRPSALVGLDVARPAPIDARRQGHGAWDDLVGLDSAKQTLVRAIEWPLQHAAQMQRFGLERANSVLLHGPPGCGKTSLARAAANVVGVPFVNVQCATVMSPFVGESEAAVRHAFQVARAVAPCVLFFDELDALVCSREGGAHGDVELRLLATFLTEMDGVSSGGGQVVVMGATNRLDAIDPALRRPGRFGDVVFVGPPSARERLALLERLTGTVILGGDVDLVALATATDGWSAAAVMGLARRAMLNALRRTMAQRASASDSGSADDEPMVCASDWAVQELGRIATAAV